MTLIEAPLTWAELNILLEPHMDRINVPSDTMAAGLMRQDGLFRISRKENRYTRLTLEGRPVLAGFHMDTSSMPEGKRLPADVDAFEALYAFTLWAGIETINVVAGTKTSEYPYMLILEDTKFVSVAGVEEVVAPISFAPIILAALVDAYDKPYSVLARHCARRLLDDSPSGWTRVYHEDDLDADNQRWLQAAGRFE